MWQFGGKDLPGAVGEMRPDAQALATLAVAEALHAIALEMRRTNDASADQRNHHTHKCVVGPSEFAWHTWGHAAQPCSLEWAAPCARHASAHKHACLVGNHAHHTWTCQGGYCYGNAFQSCPDHVEHS